MNRQRVALVYAGRIRRDVVDGVRRTFGVRRVGFLERAEGEWVGVWCRERDVEYVRVVMRLVGRGRAEVLG